MSGPIPIRGRNRRGYSVRSPISKGSLPASLSSSVEHRIRSEEEVFSFEQEFLKPWTMEDSMWTAVPEEIKTQLKFTQHAGAAVLTSLKRLEELHKHLPADEPDDIYESKSPPMSVSASPVPGVPGSTSLAAVSARLEDIQAIKDSRPNRPKPKDGAEHESMSPIIKRPSFLVTSKSNSRSPQSSSGTHSTGYMSPSAQMSPPSIVSPTSPVMAPFELPANLPTISCRESEVVLSKATLLRRDSDLFSSMTMSSGTGSQILKLKAPKHVRATMFYAELEILRQKELVRLRHSFPKIETTWRDCKADDATVANSIFAKHFEEYLQKVKAKIASLDQHIKGLCEGIHFSVGWSDAPGLDHSWDDTRVHTS